jgi:alpha-1,2-mannosyltransferase
MRLGGKWGGVIRRTWNASALIMLCLGAVAFLARLVPVLRGGGLHGVLAYDDGVYFAAAEAFVFGRLPYHDFLMLHPPGIVLVLSPFAWLARASGDDSTAFALARLAFMAVGALNAVLVFRVARARLGVVAGIAGGIFYAVWHPAVFAERTTLLEPLVNLGVLTSLLLLGDPRTASRRRLVLAGAALGLATAVKLWAVVPLVVLLCWVALRRRRAVLPYVAGAAAAATVVCLPFFLSAPATMFRLVVLDLLSRPDNAVPLARRLARMTMAIYLDRFAPHLVLQFAVLLLALALVACAVVARRSPNARPWCALLVAQSALLITSPTYYPHYSTYVAPALALLVAASADLVQARLRQVTTTWVPAALTAAVLAAVCLLASTGLRGEGRPAPAAAARAVLSTARCVAADAPATLATADLLTHNLRHDCPVLIDPTGLVYDQDPGDRPAGSSWRTRRGDVAWQQLIARWFASSEAVIVQHGNPAGLSPTTLQDLARGRTATSHQRYEVYVARDLTPRAGVEAAAR